MKVLKEIGLRPIPKACSSKKGRSYCVPGGNKSACVGRKHSKIELCDDVAHAVGNDMNLGIATRPEE